MPSDVAAMTEVQVHRAAMAALDRAELPGIGPKARRRHLRRAFELEAEAARRLVDRPKGDIARGVIHRSAAVLAARCGEWAAARRLVAEGLAGEPPGEIAAELREVLEGVPPC